MFGHHIAVPWGAGGGGPSWMRTKALHLEAVDSVLALRDDAGTDYVTDWTASKGPHVFSQTVLGRQPVWPGAGSGVVFDGTDDLLVSSADASEARCFHRHCTSIYALNITSSDATSRRLFYTAYAATQIGVQVTFYLGRVYVMLFNGTGTTAAQPYLSYTPGFHTIAMRVSTSLVDLWVDSSHTSEAVAIPPDDIDPHNSGVIGSTSPAPSMEIFEMLAWGDLLPDASVAEVQTYLSDKWAP